MLAGMSATTFACTPSDWMLGRQPNGLTDTTMCARRG